MIVSMSPNRPVSPGGYATRPLVNAITNPPSDPPYPLSPGASPGESTSEAATPLLWTACTAAMRTPDAAPPRRAVRLPPGRSDAVQGADSGTSKMLSRPPSAQPAGAAAGVRPHVADMIDVRVRQQHHVHLSEPAISLVDRASRVVEDADAGRVLEQQRPVVAAQLGCVAAERRHLDQRRRLAVRDGAVRDPEQHQ